MMKRLRMLYIKLVLCCLNLILYFGTPSIADTLDVFYPTTVRPNVMQSALAKELSCKVTVYGRFRDFSRKISSTPPDAILTKTPVAKIFKEYTIILHGTRNGATDEAYVFLSDQKELNSSNLSSNTIGVIDLFGRKGMTTFLSQFLTPLPKIKRVTKVEDLLPLLTFNMAEALLISEYHIGYFKNISQIKFVVTPIPAMKQGIIVLAVKKGYKVDNIVRSIKSMDQKHNAMLEVSGWQ